MKYRVRWHGPFPTDMLRYDSAEPADKESRKEIEDSSATSTDFIEAQRLKEARLVGPPPTVARWKSFGAFVLLPGETWKF